MAYIQAVAAIAGVQIDPPGRHDHGIDGKFVKIGLQNYPNGLRTLELAWRPLPFQAKASQKVGHGNGEMVFDLDAKNYNDAVSTAEILVLVMHHPPDIQNWLEQDVQRLSTFKQLFWEKKKVGTPHTPPGAAPWTRFPKLLL